MGRDNPAHFLFSVAVQAAAAMKKSMVASFGSTRGAAFFMRTLLS
jgi:hypothetical protein